MKGDSGIVCAYRHEATMRLARVEISNYKSLRDVTFAPGAVSVLVGPNAAGKSNLVDALDFIGDVYRWGLEAAVRHKGGYENICYRHSRRTKAPIRFRVILTDRVRAGRGSHPRPMQDVTLDHTLEFRTSSQGIGSAFTVNLERLQVYEERPAGARQEAMHLTRAVGKRAEFMGRDDSALLPAGLDVSILSDVLNAVGPDDLISFI
ncbi:MAG TPA: AAA family ATPase, partial [Thermoanaerobaculia bacterium]|nr:AAA family ATPase [Thermoanaerobaculia bacterium]